MCVSHKQAVVVGFHFSEINSKEKIDCISFCGKALMQARRRKTGRRVFRSAGLQADWTGRWPQRAAALGKPDISQPACICICICICVCISQQA